jgi:DMSO/TMAO reductase YedYZ molybdopterin-dependent catalytic subunit
MPISKVSASTQWNLQVNSASTSTNYSYDQLLSMPVTTVSANLACYGSPVASGDWSGISLSYLLEQTGTDLTAASVNFVASDGYKVSLSLEEAIRSDVIIAYQLNGAYLPEALRLVLPEYNGNMWISMITSITMSESGPQLSSGDGAKVPNISTLPSWNSSPIEAPNISQKNETIIEPPLPSIAPSTITPTIPPTNVAQPTQSSSVQQESNPKISGSTIGVIYGIAIGTAVALVVALIALVRRRNAREISFSSRLVS